MPALKPYPAGITWYALQLAEQRTDALLIGIVLLVVAAIVLAAIFYKKRSRPRIRFLPREKTVVITAAAKRHCPACSNVLAPGEETVKCTLNPAHVVHKECKQFMKGTCPTCRGALG